MENKPPTSDHRMQSEKEEDLLQRSKRRNKTGEEAMDVAMEREKEQTKASYKDAAMGLKEKNAFGASIRS